VRECGINERCISADASQLVTPRIAWVNALVLGEDGGTEDIGAESFDAGGGEEGERGGNTNGRDGFRA
jgi:hypothetical protein